MIVAQKKIEFGDFQTPLILARLILDFVASFDIQPKAVIEPTCGLGSFVRASQETFSDSEIFAFDINPDYVQETIHTLTARDRFHVHAEVQDFFDKDWKNFFKDIHGELLVVGNLPWVTNSYLSAHGGRNLPEKSNFQNHNGFAAKTGKANFDISEWMLIKIIESLGKHRACVAMLCKTATARKVLKHAWLTHLSIGQSSIHCIDAQEYFDVSVDACLFVVHTGVPKISVTANIYEELSFKNKLNTMGLSGRDIVANITEYDQLSDLDGFSYYTWRSGVKHDASRVMELTKEDDCFKNGDGEIVASESTHLYPLLKSSDLANSKLIPSRHVMLTQKYPSEDTSHIECESPLTWKYLKTHAAILDGRQSIIYQKRPRFSVFGIGDYTFAPWKVAISGLYKNLKFQVVGSFQGKPIVLDDTCYFIPCQTKEEAQFVCDLLNSEMCQRFLRAIVFLDAKRPVTIDVLSRIDLKKLSQKLGLETKAQKILVDAQRYENKQPSLVFEKGLKYRVKPPRSHSKSYH